MQLPPREERHVLFASLSILLGDEVALKDMLGFRGAAGTVPCPLCRNLVDGNSELHTFSASIVPSSCLDWSKIALHSDESVQGVLDFLKTKKRVCSQTKFNQVQQLCGYNLVDGGLLDSDIQVLPVSMLMWDWMHVYLVNGLWNTELGLLVENLNGVGFTQANMHMALSEFVWPRSISSSGTTGQQIFKKKQSGDIRCSASEGLSVYAVIRCVLQMKVDQGELTGIDGAVDSYFLLCRVLDLLQGIKSERTTAAALNAAVQSHLQAFLRVYHGHRWLPKHHYSLHLAHQFSSHQGLLSCWALERKHKEIKRYGNAIFNASSQFEHSILRDSLIAQIQDLCVHEALEVGLVEPAEAHQNATTLLQRSLGVTELPLISRQAVYSPGAVCWSGDLVLYEMEGYKVGKVLFHAQVGNTTWTCLCPLSSLGCNKFREGHQNVLVETSAIRDTVTYCARPGCVIVVPSTLW